MTDINYINPNYVGNKIMGGYRFNNKEGFIAPGHNSVLKDNWNFYIVHHIRKEYNPNCFYMHVRKILWSKDGWPMISPERYAGEVEEKIEIDLVIGLWEFLILHRDINRLINSNSYSIGDNGDISGHYRGKFYIEGENEIKIELLVHGKYETYKGKIIPAWDWEENHKTLVITAINDKGIALWGKKSRVQ